MGYAIATCLIATALFLAFLLSLALQPKALRKLTGGVFLFAGAAGLLLYGLGYGWGTRSFAEAVLAALRAANATLWMFGGRESSSTLSAVPWFANPALQFFYWMAFLSAVYVTASAVLNTLGQRLLRWLRQHLLRCYKLCLFYGEGDGVTALAEELPREERVRPLFICPGDARVPEAQADRAGGVVWTENRIDTQGKWLKSLGIRSGSPRKLELVCLHPDDGRTRVFLTKVIRAVKNQGLPASQVHILAVGELDFASFADLKLDNGQYLPVDTFTRGELTARCLVEKAPPWQVMEFDENARARGNFTALVVGFGSVGQNVLRGLVQNAQFTGSLFSAVVVDKSHADAGAFKALYADMLERYHVSFCQADVDSTEFVRLLRRISSELRYIAVCTGSEKENREVVSLLRKLHLKRPGAFPSKMVLARCSKESVTLCEPESGEERSYPTLVLEELREGSLDCRAQAIHASYLSTSAKKLYPTDLDARRQCYRDGWYQADLLSRLSSRASAAFLPAIYKTAGVDFAAKNARVRMEERLKQPGLLEILARTEHLRWSAFHSSMGITQMAPEEFYRRIDTAYEKIVSHVGELEALAARAESLPVGAREAEELLREAESLAKRLNAMAGKVRKDIPAGGLGGIHACMADWEELDVLWKRYKKLDSLLSRVRFLTAKVRYLATGQGEAPQMPESHDFWQLDEDMVLSLLRLEESGVL